MSLHCRSRFRQCGCIDLDRILADVAATQGGVVTREQAFQVGMTRRGIDRRLASGRWVAIRRGVYQVFAPRTGIDEVRAAVASLPGAVAGLWTAARLHGFSVGTDGPEAVVVHTRTTHVFGHLRVVRCHDMRRDHITEVDGLRTTTIARTVVDLAARLPFAELCRVVDSVLAEFPVSVSDLAGTLSHVARRGRPGVRYLRDILDERSDSGDLSMLESRGNELLRRADVGPFETEYPMPWNPRRRFDVAFPVQRLAIEWDGRFWHSTASAFQVDRERDRTALANGWRVARFTWDDVANAPDTVVATVKVLLDGPERSSA